MRHFGAFYRSVLVEDMADSKGVEVSHKVIYFHIKDPIISYFREFR